MRTQILSATLLALAAFAGSASAQDRLPVRDLRGYGPSSAERAGNVVAVTAASHEKALLWAARYDHVYAPHRVRSGVYRLPGGGWTRISVEGRIFRVAYSAEDPGGAFAGTLPAIPLYLNAWDDHAFRFYYRERMTPPSANPTERHGIPWNTYDPLPEFNFAKEHGAAGLVLWANGHQCDTAKGFDDRARWQWAKRLAEARGLPLVLNTNGAAPTWVLDDFREEQETGAPDYLGGYTASGARRPSASRSSAGRANAGATRCSTRSPAA